MSTTTNHAPSPTAPSVAKRRWTAGRTILLVLAVVLMVQAAASFAGAAWLAAVDEERREGDYLTSDSRSLRTSGQALTVDGSDFRGLSGDWLLGDARLRATNADPDAAVFIGVARSRDADAYLRDVPYSTVSDIDDSEAEYTAHAGSARAADPTTSDIWVARASGPGRQEVRWTPRGGSWTLVIMNADATDGVDVRADVGATVPLFDRIRGALWIVGAGSTVIAGALFAGAFRRRARRG